MVFETHLFGFPLASRLASGGGLLGLSGLFGATAVVGETSSFNQGEAPRQYEDTDGSERNGFDPMEMLSGFDYGEVHPTADGAKVFHYSPLMDVLFSAVGGGAILQVIVEVSRLLYEKAGTLEAVATSWATLGGGTMGIAVMYATALLV